MVYLISAKYPWIITFNHIQARCCNPKCKDYNNYGGRGIKCLITVGELKFLWFRDKAFKLKQASIDRENNDGNYELSNCRYIEMVENAARQDKTKQEKSINQYSLDGKFIRTWKSGHEIKRVLGFDNSSVSRVCAKRQKTSYKFVWKFNG